MVQLISADEMAEMAETVSKYGLEQVMNLWAWMIQYFVPRDKCESMWFDAVSEIDAVVVLSGASTLCPDGYWIEDSPENITRVRYGARIMERFPEAPLVLNGEAEQLEAMGRLAVEFGIEPARQVSLDCGVRGKANTATQLDVLRELAARRDWKRPVVVVSASYHVCRVVLTAIRRFPGRVIVVGVPFADDCGYGVAAKITGELRRIFDYSAPEKGDIAPPSELPILWHVPWSVGSDG